MSGRKTRQSRRETVAGAVYRGVWDSKLDECYLLHCERDAAGHITDFVFDEMNWRGAAALGLAKDAIVGRNLREVLPISRGSGLFKRYLHVAETGETLDEDCELNLAEVRARWVHQKVIATRDGIAIIARDISARKEKEFDNRQNNAFLKTLVDSLPLLVCARSCRPRDFGKVVIWNKAAERMTGYTEHELVGRAFGDDVLADIDSAMDSIVGEVQSGAQPAEISHPFVKRDGTLRQLRTIVASLQDQYGKPEYILGIAEDITEHAAALEQVRLASIVFEHATEAIVVSDAQDRVVTVNRAFSVLTGYSEAEAAGRAAAEFESSGIGLPDTATVLAQVEREGSWSGPGAQLRKGETPFPTWRNVARVDDDAGRIVNYVRIATDITAIEQSREQLEQQANHDALTGLPNRRLFMDRLTHALERCVRLKQKLALLFVDIDHFKAVNDRLGHVVGDALLKEIANRLSRSARAVDTVCRLGGDEFTIIIEDSGRMDWGEAGLVAERIIDALSKPFALSGHTFTASVSIGISLYPADGADTDALIRNADKALYRAKELGRNRYRYFSELPEGKPARRIDIETELGIAIEQQQLFLVYEPMVHLTTGATVGFEALVRWNHPGAGTLRPDQFIHVAEATGLIVPLGEWVLRRACADIQRWEQQGLSDFLVSVNVSAVQFQRGNLLDVVRRALRDYDIAPSRLELEVTESALLDSLPTTRNIAVGLKALGVSTCVDDFGTGYSSFLLLRRIAPDRLKIDRTFISDLPDDKGTVDIVRAILVLARALGMGVVAEGVETPAQLQVLKSLDCTRAQGYFFSRPVLPEDVPALLAEQRLLPSRLMAVGAKRTPQHAPRARVGTE